jgi:hypothetical protein
MAALEGLYLGLTEKVCHPKKAGNFPGGSPESKRYLLFGIAPKRSKKR